MIAIIILLIVLIPSLLVNYILIREKIAYDGKMVLRETETGGKRFVLELNDTPIDFDKKKTIVFKVDTTDSSD